MLVLWDHEEGVAEGVAGGIPLAELKRYISTDRSNARRAIRGLIDRGLVAETTDEEGVRRVSLTGGGHLACWLASYADERLTLGAVPSRPLYLSALYGEADEDGGNPHGTTEPPWNNDAASELPVNDNTPSNPDRGYPMNLRKPHVPSPLPPDRPVRDNALGSARRGDAMPMGTPHANAAASPDPLLNDNDGNRGSLALEILAKLARRRLESLDEGEGP